MTRPLEDLDTSIRKAHIAVKVLALVALFSYVLWFWLYKSQPLSESPSDWGVFGDFLGGVLNPVVAYAAFYWLTQSVRIQKQELSETRKALVDAAAAQEAQARYSRTTVQLNALAALANSIAAEVRMTQTELQFVVDQVARDSGSSGARSLDGDRLHSGQVEEHLFQKRQRIRRRMDEQEQIEVDIQRLLQDT